MSRMFHSARYTDLKIVGIYKLRAVILSLWSLTLLGDEHSQELPKTTGKQTFAL